MSEWTSIVFLSYLLLPRGVDATYAVSHPPHPHLPSPNDRAPEECDKNQDNAGLIFFPPAFLPTVSAMRRAQLCDTRVGLGRVTVTASVVILDLVFRRGVVEGGAIITTPTYLVGRQHGMAVSGTGNEWPEMAMEGAYSKEKKIISFEKLGTDSCNYAGWQPGA